MKITQSEKDIENQILEVLTLHGILCWKNQSVGIFDPKRRIFRKSKNKYHMNGVSDVLGVFKGRFLAIEVKKPGEKPTECQQQFLDNVWAKGGIAFIAYSVDDALKNLGLPK